MKTNFFTLVWPILQKGVDLTLTLKADGENIIAAVKPSANGKGDDYKMNAIRPIMLTHPAEKFDEGFFDTISQPADQYAENLKEVEAWLGSLKTVTEEAKKEKKSRKAGKSKTAKKSAAPAKKEAVKAKPGPKPKEDKEPVDKALKTGTKFATAAKAAFDKGQLKRARGLYKQAYDAKALEQWKIEFDRLEGLIADQKKKEKEDKQKEANIGKATEIFKQAQEAFNVSDYPAALERAQKASDLVPTQERKEFIERVELIIHKEKMKAVEPFLIRAEAALKGTDYPTCAENWKRAKALMPDHPKLKEIHEALVVQVKEPTASFLLGITIPTPTT